MRDTPTKGGKPNNSLGPNRSVRPNSRLVFLRLKFDSPQIVDRGRTLLVRDNDQMRTAHQNSHLDLAEIRVHIVPNAKVNDVVGQHGEAIKIKLRAPAIEGKANAALIAFLSERLRISTRHVALLKGHKSRDKVIRIDGVTQDQLRERLLRTS